MRQHCVIGDHAPLTCARTHAVLHTSFICRSCNLQALGQLQIAYATANSHVHTDVNADTGKHSKINSGFGAQWASLMDQLLAQPDDHKGKYMVRKTSSFSAPQHGCTSLTEDVTTSTHF